MPRRATRPLNRTASQKANDDLYRAHTDDPRPNALYDKEGKRKALKPDDPAQAGLREEWLDSYEAHGGEVEEPATSPGTQRQVGEAVQPCPLCWVAFRIVDKESGEPISQVQLEVAWPSGRTSRHATDGLGYVEIASAEAGSYGLTSPIKEASLDTLLEPGGLTSTGEKPKRVSPPATDADVDDEEDLYPLAEGQTFLGMVREHKVKTGETLAGIAKENGLTWRELAQFNWETTEPKRINRHLRDDLGCRKKAQDGYNYLLSDKDDPGILYLPTAYKKEGLAHNQTHTVEVTHTNVFLIILENEAGLRIPLADYEATFADGSTQTGKLGRNGVARIENPPAGDIEVVYTNLDDVEAKSLAVSIREAFDRRDYDEALRVISHSPEMLKAAIAAYGSYSNDLSGKGLIEDLYQETTDEDALQAMEGLLLDAEQPVRSGARLVEWDPERELNEEIELMPGANGDVEPDLNDG